MFRLQGLLHLESFFNLYKISGFFFRDRGKTPEGSESCCFFSASRYHLHVLERVISKSTEPSNLRPNGADLDQVNSSGGCPRLGFREAEAEKGRPAYVLSWEKPSVQAEKEAGEGAKRGRDVSWRPAEVLSHEGGAQTAQELFPQEAGLLWPPDLAIGLITASPARWRPSEKG